ncbi:MAG: tetratricopeptide repeat protein [Planctomycetota bacterium]
MERRSPGSHLALALLLCCVGAGSGCSPPTQPDPLAPDRVREELERLEAGLRPFAAASEEARVSATRRLDAILAEQPSHQRARLLRARLRLAWGEPAGCLEDVDALEQAYGQDAGTIELRGEARWQQRRYADALRLFQTCLEAEPVRTTALCRVGDALRLRERGEQARGYYQRVLALDPQHAEARSGLAALGSATVSKLGAGAKPADGAASAESPAARGQRLVSAGKYAAAVEPLVAALRAAPHDQRLLWALERALRELGRQAEAERVLSALAVEAGQDPQRQLACGRALLALTKRPTAAARAERLLERAVAAAPTDATTHHALARARAVLGRPSAREAFEQALARSPKDPAVCCDYGLYLARRGALGAAIRVYRAGLERDPEHRALLANLMVALFEDGQEAEGERLRAALAAEDGQGRGVTRLLTRYAPRTP